MNPGPRIPRHLLRTYPPSECLRLNRRVPSPRFIRRRQDSGKGVDRRRDESVGAGEHRRHGDGVPAQPEGGGYDRRQESPETRRKLQMRGWEEELLRVRSGHGAQDLPRGRCEEPGAGVLSIRHHHAAEYDDHGEEDSVVRHHVYEGRVEEDQRGSEGSDEQFFREEG